MTGKLGGKVAFITGAARGQGRSQVSTRTGNALPVDMVEPAEVSNANLWLVSDDAQYITGVTLPVDAGYTNNR